MLTPPPGRDGRAGHSSSHKIDGSEPLETRVVHLRSGPPSSSSGGKIQVQEQGAQGALVAVGKALLIPGGGSKGASSATPVRRKILCL